MLQRRKERKKINKKAQASSMLQTKVRGLIWEKTIDANPIRTSELTFFVVQASSMLQHGIWESHLEIAVDANSSG
jgi:hypothetical protein